MPPPNSNNNSTTNSRNNNNNNNNNNSNNNSINTAMHVNLKFIVVLIFLVPTITILITYPVAMTRDHTANAILPYISATLNYPPESCIGTFGLSIASTLIMLLNVIRLVYVRAWIRKTGFNPDVVVNRLNTAGVIVGMIFALSLNGVFSVQYHINRRVHNSFAATLFFSGTIYMCLQSFMEYYMYKQARRGTKKSVLLLRIACAALGVFLYAPSFLDFGVILFSQLHTPVWQAIGAAVEITMAVLFFIFYCSYHMEWRAIALVVDIHWDEFLPLINRA